GVDLAQPAAQLPLHAHGLGSLLGEGRRVQNKYAIGLTQLDTDLADQFVQEGAVVPEGLAQELLQGLPLLIVQVGDGLGVLVVQLGEQSLDVVLGVVPLLGACQRGDEGLQERLQAWQHAPQETRWDFSIVKQFLEADAETSLHRPSPFGTLGSPKGGYTASTYSRSGTRHSRGSTDGRKTSGPGPAPAVHCGRCRRGGRGEPEPGRVEISTRPARRSRPDSRCRGGTGGFRHYCARYSNAPTTPRPGSPGARGPVRGGAAAVCSPRLARRVRAPGPSGRSANDGLSALRTACMHTRSAARQGPQEGRQRYSPASGEQVERRTNPGERRCSTARPIRPTNPTEISL